jgi:hypothetical protein
VYTIILTNTFIPKNTEESGGVFLGYVQKHTPIIYFPLGFLVFKHTYCENRDLLKLVSDGQALKTSKVILCELCALRVPSPSF